MISSKDVKGESTTMPAMVWSSAAYMIEVAAPILLPHNPIRDTVPVFHKYSTTAATSCFS